MILTGGGQCTRQTGFTWLISWIQDHHSIGFEAAQVERLSRDLFLFSSGYRDGSLEQHSPHRTTRPERRPSDPRQHAGDWLSEVFYRAGVLVGYLLVARPSPLSDSFLATD